MAEFPRSYGVRSPGDHDASAIADVVQALDVADFGEPDFSEQDLLDDWLRPRFDRTTDAWVLTGPTGRVIGYAYVWEAQPNREIEGDAYILPEYSGRGLGTQLLDLMEARARDICAGRILSLAVFASSANDDKRNLLERRGFELTRAVVRMRIDLSQEMPAPQPAPRGVEIRPLAPTDEDVVREVWIDAFGDHGRFSSRHVDEWLQGRYAHPAFDPSLWRVATEAEHTLGAVLVFDVGPTGYLSSVGVKAEARGRGIGPALLASAFAALRDRGQMRVVVSLDADAEAPSLALYEAAGMRVHERHDCFTKTLD